MATASPPRDRNGRVLPNWPTLLQSGLFTDVTVRCGAREWKLHRAVICVKSAWFEKALCGDFKEAKSREIDIQQIDPSLLDWIIKCIYHMVNEDPEACQVDEVDGLQNLLDDPETGMLAHVQLHETADYFLLPTLCWWLETSLGSRLSSLGDLVRETYPKETAKKTMQPGNPQLLLDLLPQSQRDILFQAIDHAFMRDYQHKGLQTQFVKFVQDTNFWILHDEAFKTKLSAVPKMAASILELVMESNLGQVFHVVPKTCLHGARQNTRGQGREDGLWKGLELGLDARELVVGSKQKNGYNCMCRR